MLEATTKAKAAKRSEEVLVTIAGATFNGRFLADAPAGAFILGKDPKDDPAIIRGPVNYMICPVRLPEEKAAAKGA